MQAVTIPARPCFTDQHNPPRSWPLVIHLGHIREIQSIHPDFRLERIVVLESPEAQRIESDSVVLCDVLEVLLRQSLRDRGVTFGELLESLGTGATDAVYLALVSAVANFSHSRVVKDRARQILIAFEALRQLDSQIGSALEMNSGMPSGPVPPSPEWSPGVTPSGNSVPTLLSPATGKPSPSASISEPYPLSHHNLPVSTP